MKQITNITEDAKQKFNIILDDNSVVDFTLEYLDSQQGWNFSLTRNDFIINNNKLLLGLNILRQFKNYIPFGISVFSTDGLDPSFIEDFKNERITLYVLNSDEIEEIEETYYEQ